MISWIKKNKANILGPLFIWYAVGALFGIIDTLNARSNILAMDPNHKYSSGCTYTSLSGVLNPGYVIACELGRARWNWEPGGNNVHP
jgi:hypothetical protein